MTEREGVAAAAMVQRKTEHLDLCVERDVEARSMSTLLEEVHLIHHSLPELAVDELNLERTLFGKTLRAPLIISGMTGGTDRAGEINRRLASVAQQAGIAFGVGSQRPMLDDPTKGASYRVRDVAPGVLLLANIGVMQAHAVTTEAVRELVESIEADALCVHMNPAQELVQSGGDRDFRGAADTLERLAEELSVPVIAKETGCGVSRTTAVRLKHLGVEWVDVSGVGGTTWIGVESLRATEQGRSVGESFWDWGIPTAASIVFARDSDLHVIASGGLRDGLDVARSLALGASVASMALPFLRAVEAGGEPAALELVETIIRGLETAMILSGAKDLDALAVTPRLVGDPLRAWCAAGRAVIHGPGRL